MVAFVVRGGNDRAARFLRTLNLVREATSLGGVETLIIAPHHSSQFSYTLRSSTWPASDQAWCGSRSASSEAHVQGSHSRVDASK
jgi:hypothetical protein